MMDKLILTLLAAAFVAALFWFVRKILRGNPLIEHSATPSVRSSTVDDRPLLSEVRELALQGKKLQAVKLHKTEAKISLFEAKQAVEAYLEARER